MSYQMETATMDRGVTSAPEIRVQEGAGGLKIEGFAAVYESRSELLFGEFYEVIKRGAFKKVLDRKPDVRFLIEHRDLPLARTTSGTLVLEERPNGLFFSASLDAGDPDVQRVLPKIRRGDLTGMSFGFLPAEDGVEFEILESGEILRSVSEIRELADVSIVGNPAYTASSLSLRMIGDFKSQRDEEARKIRTDALKARLAKAGEAMK